MMASSPKTSPILISPFWMGRKSFSSLLLQSFHYFTVKLFWKWCAMVCNPANERLVGFLQQSLQIVGYYWSAKDRFHFAAVALATGDIA